VLLAYAEPFDEQYAARQFRRAGVFVPGTPRLDLIGQARLADLLARCDADVVFLDGNTWMTGRWFPSVMRRTMDSLPCPAVCVDATRDDLQWHLPHNPARTVRPVFTADSSPRPVGELVFAH